MTFHESPPLADNVIDRLFSSLIVRYGSPFVDRWRDIDLAVVKQDWARQLAGFGKNLDALKFGLDHLPEKPPTVLEFRKIANAAPGQYDPHALVYNVGQVRGPTPSERETLRRLAVDIRAGRLFAKPGREWARDLLASHEAGERWGRPFQSTPAGLQMAREALGAKDGGDD